MTALSEQNLAAREFFVGTFGARFPRSFKALQHVVMSAANVAQKAGTKNWRGQDKGKPAYDKFIADTKVLMAWLNTEGYYGSAAGDDEDDLSKLFRLVQFFFTAYPNWQDAKAIWDDFEQWMREG